MPDPTRQRFPRARRSRSPTMLERLGQGQPGQRTRKSLPCRSPRSCSTCRSSRQAAWCGHRSSVAPGPAALTPRPAVGRALDLRATRLRRAEPGPSRRVLAETADPPTNAGRPSLRTHQRRDHDRATCYPQHVRDRADLPGTRVTRVRRLYLQGGQGRLGRYRRPRLKRAEHQRGDSEFDFRVGGHERFGVGYQGAASATTPPTTTSSRTSESSTATRCTPMACASPSPSPPSSCPSATAEPR